MIEIRNKRDCCGCNACVQKCPQQCIGQSEDAEGFIYPQVDKARCVGCGLCEKVCPVINQNPKSKPLKVMAGRNGNEEIRMQSPQAEFSHYWQNRSSAGAGLSSVPGSTRTGMSYTVTPNVRTDWLHSGAANTYKAGSGRHSGKPENSCDRAARYYSPEPPARLRDCIGSSEKNTTICSPWTSYATEFPVRVYGKSI